MDAAVLFGCFGAGLFTGFALLALIMREEKKSPLPPDEAHGDLPGTVHTHFKDHVR